VVPGVNPERETEWAVELAELEDEEDPYEVVVPYCTFEEEA
jgi:hypothetical protein